MSPTTLLPATDGTTQAFSGQYVLLQPDAQPWPANTANYGTLEDTALPSPLVPPSHRDVAACHQTPLPKATEDLDLNLLQPTCLGIGRRATVRRFYRTAAPRRAPPYFAAVRSREPYSALTKRKSRWVDRQHRSANLLLFRRHCRHYGDPTAFFGFHRYGTRRNFWRDWTCGYGESAVALLATSPRSTPGWARRCKLSLLMQFGTGSLTDTKLLGASDRTHGSGPCQPGGWCHLRRAAGRTTYPYLTPG